MPALLAAAPLALIIALMLGLRWPAARAGLAGLAVALGVAYLGFGYGDAVLGEIGPARAGVFAFAEAGFTAATILWIIFPALCVYEIQKRSGAFDVIRAGLASVSTDRRVQVLLIAWFFALFMEGAAGFGTPVALAAPLLVSLGFAPLKAVTLALIGHAAGVSFGAVGTPIVAQANLTGISAQAIGQWTGLMHLLVGAVLVVLLMRVADDGRFVMRDSALAALAALCFPRPCRADRLCRRAGIADFRRRGDRGRDLSSSRSSDSGWSVLTRRQRMMAQRGPKAGGAEMQASGPARRRCCTLPRPISSSSG